MKKIEKKQRMTYDEMMGELRSSSALNRARQVFSTQMAKIEQADAQLQIPDPIDRRRMEFEAVMKIAEVLGVKL